MTHKILKVGFDLDGVLLYNPARIVRPIIATIKKVVVKNRQIKFYYPKTSAEKYIWTIFHKSSLFIAPGFDEIISMVKNKRISAYIVTSRYSFLKNDLNHWLQKLEIDNLFDGIHCNENDEQPHIFKEKILKKLNLDIFVEDN